MGTYLPSPVLAVRALNIKNNTPRPKRARSF